MFPSASIAAGSSDATFALDEERFRYPRKLGGSGDFSSFSDRAVVRVKKTDKKFMTLEYLSNESLHNAGINYETKRTH